MIFDSPDSIQEICPHNVREEFNETYFNFHLTLIAFQQQKQVSYISDNNHIPIRRKHMRNYIPRRDAVKLN